MTTEHHEGQLPAAPLRHVIVLNQFAVPPDLPGGARHARLFGRLSGWSTTIVAGNHSHSTQRRVRTADSRFRLVWVPPHHRRAVLRMVGWFIYAIQAFAVTMTRRRLDLVYGSSPHLLAPFAGLLAARLRRVPFILEVRDLWPESIVAAGMLREGSTIHKILSRLEQALAGGADSIVVVTPGWEDHFAALGVPLERLTVIPNGTDLDEFALDETREELRQSLGVRGFTAVYAGAHGAANALDLLIDAAAAVPDVGVILIGDGAEKARLQEVVRRSNIENVEFRSPVPKAQLAALLTACDVGVHVLAPLAVLDRGLSPNKIFDYMAAGLPVVSNAQDGLRAVLSDGECGHLGGPDSLAEGLRRARDASTAERAAWSARGRQIILQRYSRQEASRRLEHSLDTAVARHRQLRREASVAHVTTAHPTLDNRIFRKECAALRSAGISVTLVAVATKDDEVDGVPILALPRRSGRLARMVIGPLDVWRALRRLRPTLIHVHDPELIPLAVLWRLAPGRRAVFDAHEDLPKQVLSKPYLPRRLRRCVAAFARSLERLADRRLDAIVAATPSIARNFTHAKVSVVQNFPWLHEYPEPEPMPAADVVVHVGGLSPPRGVAEMVRAILDSRHDVELVVAGPVTSQAQAVLDSAGTRVRNLGVRPASEVPSIVAGGRIGLVLFHPIPNHLESQPTKLFEYMAAGRPFIASDFPAWRTLVGDIDAGVFVDPLNPDEIRIAIDTLLDDRERATRMGERGRAAVCQRLNFDHEAERLVSLTRQLMKR